MHNHSLALDNGLDLIAIRTAVTVEEMKFSVYPYTFRTMEKGPFPLVDVYSAGLFA